MTDTHFVDIQLEDDVPLQDKPYRGPAISSPYRKVMREMEVGQSFLIYGKREANRARNAADRESKLSGKKFRKIQTGDGTWRVWRTA